MRDYLSAYLGENHAQMLPAPVPKVSKATSVTFGTTQGVGIWQKKKIGELILTPPKTYPAQVPKVPKPTRKPKAWRREPYYPPCVAATMQDGRIQRRAADELFAALALMDGHEPDYVAEMLRSVSPAVSCTANYYQEIVNKVDANREVILTEASLSLYIEHHPFAWELQLSSTLERGKDQ